MMKLLLLPIILLLSFTSLLKSQDYQPFSKNSYLYKYGDGYYKLSVDSVAANDSMPVFYFNTIVHLDLDSEHAAANADNVFGRYFIKLPGGEYQFVTSKDTFVLKTVFRQGASWLFSKRMGINAKITGKYNETVLGEKDSVIHIKLSTGDTIKLSKHYGLLSGKPFIKYPLAEEKMKWLNEGKFQLVSIPSQKKGMKYPDFADFFSFKPGSQITYKGTSDNLMGNPRKIWFEKRDILETIISPGRDNVTIKYNEKYYEANYSQSGAEMSSRNRPATLNFSQYHYGYLKLNSNQLHNYNPNNQINKDYLLKAIKTNANGDFTFYFSSYVYHKEIVIVYSSHSGNETIFSQNFGETLFYQCCNFERRLICHTFNGITHGNCEDSEKYLSIEENDKLQTAFSFFPNPASDQLNIVLKPGNYNPGKAIIKILDQQGKLQHLSSIHFSEPDQFILNTSTLTAGLYFIHILTPDGKTETAKFVISK